MTVLASPNRTPLFLLGIGMNLIGIVVIARQLRLARRACAVVEQAASILNAREAGPSGG